MKIRKKCDTCEYWLRDTEMLGAFSKGSCELFGNPVGRDLDTSKASLFTLRAPSKLYFLTAPDFGCTEHKLKVSTDSAESPQAAAPAPDEKGNS